MPTENNSHIGFTVFGETIGGEVVPIGKLSDIEFITGDEFNDMAIPEMGCEGTLTFNLKPEKYSRKAIKWFRQNMGLDLLIIMFPKKKRRREKRLKRKKQMILLRDIENSIMTYVSGNRNPDGSMKD